MDVIQLFLIILFVILAFLLIRLIFYHPPAAVVRRVTPYREEEEPVLWPVPHEILKRNLKIRCPEADLLFDQTELEHGLLMEYRGTCAEGENKLIVFSENETAPSFFRALEVRLEQGGIRGRLYAVYTMNDRQLAAACREACEVLQKKNVSFRTVFMEGGGELQLNGRTVPYLSTGSCAYCRAEIKGSEEDIRKWKESICEKLPFDQKRAGRLCAMMHDSQLKLQMRIPFLRQKAVRNLKTSAPDACFLYMPVTEGEDIIRISAQTDELMERTISCLREEADQHHLLLYLHSQKKASVSPDAGITEAAVKAAAGSWGLEDIPAGKSMQREELPAAAVCFPFEKGEQAALYYEKILQL